MARIQSHIKSGHHTKIFSTHKDTDYWVLVISKYFNFRFLFCPGPLFPRGVTGMPTRSISSYKSKLLLPSAALWRTVLLPSTTPFTPEPFKHTYLVTQRLFLKMYAALYVKPQTRSYKACIINVLVDKPVQEQAGERATMRLVLHVVVIKIQFGLDDKINLNIFDRIIQLLLYLHI